MHRLHLILASVMLTAMLVTTGAEARGWHDGGFGLGLGVGLGLGGCCYGPAWGYPGYYSGYYPGYAYYAPPVVYEPAPAPYPSVVYMPPPTYAAPAVVQATEASPVYVDSLGRSCRQFQSPTAGSGVACLQPDGSWRVTQ